MNTNVHCILTTALVIYLNELKCSFTNKSILDIKVPALYQNTSCYSNYKYLFPQYFNTECKLLSKLFLAKSSKSSTLLNVMQVCMIIGIFLNKYIHIKANLL